MKPLILDSVQIIQKLYLFYFFVNLKGTESQVFKAVMNILVDPSRKKSNTKFNIEFIQWNK